MYTQTVSRTRSHAHTYRYTSSHRVVQTDNLGNKFIDYEMNVLRNESEVRRLGTYANLIHHMNFIFICRRSERVQSKEFG